jgi:hypothetical protein
MVRNLLRDSQMSMSETACVEKAKGWLEALCEEESRGRGDFTEAVRRVALRLRIPFGFFNELLYRSPPPKKISGGRLLTLAMAYDDCLQRRKYKEERAAFNPSTALGRAMVRAADYLSGEEGEDLK